MNSKRNVNGAVSTPTPPRFQRLICFLYKIVPRQCENLGVNCPLEMEVVMRLSVFLILVSGLGLNVALADVPTRLEYQGYLTDLVGVPIDCNNASDCTDMFIFTFSLHDGITEGNLLWTEVHYTVDITNGVFHVELGAEQAIDAALLTNTVWLQIRVNDQPPDGPTTTNRIRPLRPAGQYFGTSYRIGECGKPGRRTRRKLCTGGRYGELHRRRRAGVPAGIPGL